MDSVRFEVTTPAADAGSRRLTTAARVRALIGSPPTDDAKLESIIDGISAECARHCKLARPFNMASPPTFGQEVVKATWLAGCDRRPTALVLPWRVAISSIGQVVENGVNLTTNVDYQLTSGGLLERLSGDRAANWSHGKIVVPYTAGWMLPNGVPAELERQVIEQVKMAYLTIDDEPGLRAEAVPDVYSASFSVAGGDTIGESGLLRSLEAALDAFKNWAMG